MHGTRHLAAAGWGRSFALLSSVLALLAFACFPIFAQAASVPEYEVAEPCATGSCPKDSNEIQTRSAPPDKSPKGGGGQSGAVEDESAGQAGSGGPPSNGKSSKSRGSDAGSDRDKRQGSPGDGSGGKPQAPLEGSPTAATTSDDGSSPLVPILIAIAVLAAISIGVVLMRQRRGPDEPAAPVSPKAS
jgi:cobalamin biosynthesis Mg chelatase CobN